MSFLLSYHSLIDNILHLHLNPVIYKINLKMDFLIYI